MKLDRKKILHRMIDLEINNIELSKRSGVSIARISNVINHRNTTYETACKIAKVLSFEFEDIVEKEKKDERNENNA